VPRAMAYFHTSADGADLVGKVDHKAEKQG
jgi:hypothetical protein